MKELAAEKWIDLIWNPLLAFTQFIFVVDRIFPFAVAVKLGPGYIDPCSVFEVAKFVRARSGNSLLLDKNGYVYKRNSKNNTSIYWICRNHTKTTKCFARATTDGNHVTYWKGSHDHPSNIVESDMILDNWK